MQQETQEEERVPETYDELYRDYSSVVARQLGRLNKVRVKDRVDDLFSHIWLKLLEVDILRKYRESSVLPRTCTGEEAAAYCGVAFPRWKVMVWRGIKGDKRTKGSDARTLKDGVPKPIHGGWSSKKAVYDMREIASFFVTRPFNENCKRLSVPRDVPTAKVRFRAYLMMAINNHFKNFCRTKKRREQEEYLSPLEDGSAWESRLSDAFACDAEKQVDLKRALEAAEAVESGDSSMIAHLIASGHSKARLKEMADVVHSVLGAPRARVVA